MKQIAWLTWTVWPLNSAQISINYYAPTHKYTHTQIKLVPLNFQIRPPRNVASPTTWMPLSFSLPLPPGTRQMGSTSLWIRLRGLNKGTKTEMSVNSHGAASLSQWDASVLQRYQSECFRAGGLVCDGTLLKHCFALSPRADGWHEKKLILRYSEGLSGFMIYITIYLGMENHMLMNPCDVDHIGLYGNGKCDTVTNWNCNFQLTFSNIPEIIRCEIWCNVNVNV